MNFDSILKENAILEGTSYLVKLYEAHGQQEVYYLARNVTVLCALPYRKGMTIITRLCGQHCPFDGKLDSIHGFEDVETMHKQLESEKVCSYKYFETHRTSFKLGLHANILDNLFFHRYNDTTLVFEDGHDLPLQLERAMSATLNTQTVQGICKTFLQQQGNWEHQLNYKLLGKNFRQSTFVTQSQYNLLMPLIAFSVKIVQYQQKVEYEKLKEILTECTTAIQEQEFVQYLKLMNLTLHINCNPPKYQCINVENYEKYLEDLFPHRQLFQQWYILIKQAFNEQQNQRDYKVVLYVDILQQNKFHLSLICLNPLCGITQLKQQGVKNILIITNHSYPPKLYKTELNLHFVFYPQIPVQELQLNCKIITKIHNIPIDFLQQDQDLLALELGKLLQILNFQLNDHALITLFSSKSFMQKCQDIWGQQSILQSLGVNREFQWLKYQNRHSVHDSAKQFLNQCRFNTNIKDTMPSLYTIFNDQLLDSLAETFQIIQQKSRQQTLKSSCQITVLLIGVPWASQFMYPSDHDAEPQMHLNYKLEWLTNCQNPQYDRKYFSMVSGMRNISRLQHTFDKLNPCNLLVLDEKFQQKLLWKEQKIPDIMAFSDAVKELQKITPSMARSEKSQPMKKTQNIRIQIQEPNTLKRKIMLNKVQLSDFYNPIKKSMPAAQTSTEKITIEDIIGRSEEKEQQSQNEEKCVICWANAKATEMCKSSKCGHVACKECWKTWLQTKLECPLCRARVREKFLIQI